MFENMDRVFGTERNAITNLSKLLDDLLEDDEFESITLEIYNKVSGASKLLKSKSQNELLSNRLEKAAMTIITSSEQYNLTTKTEKALALVLACDSNFELCQLYNNATKEHQKNDKKTDFNNKEWLMSTYGFDDARIIKLELAIVRLLQQMLQLNNSRNK